MGPDPVTGALQRVRRFKSAPSRAFDGNPQDASDGVEEEVEEQLVVKRIKGVEVEKPEQLHQKEKQGRWDVWQELNTAVI